MIMDRKTKKNILAFLYFTILSFFIFFIFTHYSIEELKNFEFVNYTKEWLTSFSHDNIFISSLVFILFCIIWVFFLGFGSPLAIFAGIYFGSLYGTLLTVTSLTVGSTLLYTSAKYFLPNRIKNIFLKKYLNQKLVNRFHNNELKFFIIYRFIAEIPFGIANLIAVFFNMKTKNFILGTFIGLFPSIFILSSIGAGLETVIFNHEVFNKENFPSILEMLKSSEIYIPLLFFIIFLVAIYVFKKLLFKENKK
jgi:uncharacterized membrane protein YdjX (TVP38/TMEM64 family)